MPVLQINPVTKLGMFYDDNKLIITHKQDCTDVVEDMKRCRSTSPDRKAEFKLFASLPNTIVYKLKLQGIDIFRMHKDPSMRKRFLREIQYEYPHLKAVDWKHL